MKKIKVFIMLVFSTLSYSAGSIGDKGEENSSEIESVKVEELEKIKIPTNNSEIKITSLQHLESLITVLIKISISGH